MNAMIKDGVLTVNATAFIIPNNPARVARMKDFCRDNVRNLMTRIGELNQSGQDDNEDLIEMWFASLEDLECENMCDHIFEAKDEAGVSWYGRMDSRYIPLGLLNGHKEGDVIEINYPLSMKRTKDGIYDFVKNEMDVTLKMKVSLDQTKWRYDHHGPFEDCLAYVLS